MRFDFAELFQRGRNFCKEGVVGRGGAQVVEFGERSKDDCQDGRDTTQTPAPQQKNRRRQDKTHQNRNCDRNEYFAPDIKRRHQERD
jgi:hypothetical protein